MTDMGNLAITPSEVVKRGMTFSIPIYQRLFSWTPTEINVLLDNLYYQYEKEQKHYYIGLLTSTKNSELVDGQQRFSVMMLLSIALKKYYEDWEKFVYYDGHLRLVFTARKDDQKYLESLINPSLEMLVKKNDYMEKGYNAIVSFFEKTESFPNDEKRMLFAKYIYEHLAFFIQILPDGYSGRMLNKYFESMNSTGRNLENHEILKVHLLEMAGVGEDKDEYDQLVTMWNLASRMNETIYSVSDDKYDEYRNRIRNIKNYVFDIETINEKSKTILDVINSDITSLQNKRTGNISSKRSFLTFTDFLLQVLYIILPKEVKEKLVKQEFFKPENLRNTFSNYSGYYDAKSFIETMFKYRIILDWAIIRIDNEGDYCLAMSSEENPCLQQYEAMLFASSSRFTYYQWIPFVLEEIMKNQWDEDTLLQKLKDKDNEVHKRLDFDKMTFKSFDNYYFRRLDYYLWELIIHPQKGNEGSEKDSFLTKLFAAPDSLNPADINEMKSAVRGYKFHQYNSVEHLYPQNDEKQNNRWKDLIGDVAYDQINKIGNLVLVSKEFNSTQGNDAMNEKFVRIHTRQIVPVPSRLESVKLAIMYYSVFGKGEKWTPEVADAHENKMMQILKDSYPC